MMLDPYRTLGLVPGATPDEIRRAYRRLAKTYHPDSAGEQALPRFLAIQAAYETLIVRRPGARPPRRPAPTGPWQADAERARATREEARRRARSGTGPRPTGNGTAGTSQGSAGQGPTADPSRSRSGSARGRAGTGGSGSGGARTGSTRRSRPANRATPGSTTYDATEDETPDTTWAGATWYGASSGTYWRVNPREYADPRKHGPDYLRRAARPVPGDGSTPPSDDEARPTEPDPMTESATWDGPPPPRPATGPWSSTSAAPPPSAPRVEPAVEATMDRILEPERLGVVGRLILALGAWLPIGTALATLAGEATGCSRFAATCPDGGLAWLWIVQLAIVAVLAMLPSVASIAAFGTAGMLVAAVPGAVILSITGGTTDPAGSALVLIVILAAGWLAGIGIGLVRRRHLRSRVPAAQEARVR